MSVISREWDGPVEDFSRAAAILTAETIRSGEVSESDAIETWSRHRSRMIDRIEAIDKESVDDSAVFEEADDSGDDSFEWSADDDTLEVRFPSDRKT